ncbi:MAG: tetratricopeptide repeat protein [Bryobacteraceae bacterium]|jgi:tetratricopeptide (TPR) repeat protein
MFRVCLPGVFLLLCGSLAGVHGYAATFEQVAAEAEAARDAHDVPRAIELYRSAVALHPDWQAGWWFLGTLLYGSRQYADARNAIQHLADLNHNAGPAWGLLGLCESETGDYVDALRHVQKALTIDGERQSELEDVLRSREALLLTRNGQFDTAIERYVQFLRGGAPSEPLLAALGVAALRWPLLPAEVPAEQQKLIVRAGKAYLAMISADPQAAGKSLRELVEAFPSEPGVHYLYASWLIKSDQDLEIAELKRELSIAPGSAVANQMLAWTLLQHGDIESAFPYAEAAIRANAESPIAQAVWGRVLAETGHVKDAIHYLESSASVDPNNLETRIALASAYGRAGRYQDAMRERREALKLKEEAHGARN